MLKPLLIIFLFVCAQSNAFSQLHYITGTVKDESGKVLPGVEVFLNGTGKVALTNEEGIFNILRLISGNYELVAKLLGRETYRSTFTLSKSSRFNIVLQLKNHQLAEVVIKADQYLKSDYMMFQRVFIGETPNAVKCKIVNPEILNIYKDPETKNLHVNSGGKFLQISNPALGYHVKYLLEDFVYDKNKGYSYYVGQTLFKEMAGTVPKIANWNKARVKAYLGSPQHLLKSIYHNNVEEQGFVIRKLLVKTNNEIPTEKEFVKKRDLLDKQLSSKSISKQQYKDSIDYWISKFHLPRYTQTVQNDTLKSASLTGKDDGINKQLAFTDQLHIMYLNEKPDIHYRSGAHKIGLKKSDYKYQMSTIAIREYVPLIDAHGNLANPLSLLYNEYMGRESVGYMLPKHFVYQQPEIEKEP